MDDDDDDSLHRPSSLLAHINAATRKTILGDAALGAGVYAAGHKAEETAVEREPARSHDGHDGSGWVRTVTPVGIAAGAADTSHTTGTADDDDVARDARARYSFAGDGVGELALTAGTEVVILDDRDPS